MLLSVLEQRGCQRLTPAGSMAQPIVQQQLSVTDSWRRAACGGDKTRHVTDCVTAPLSRNVGTVVVAAGAAQAVLLRVVAEGPETHAQHFRGLHLHAAGARQRERQIVPVELLAAGFEVE